MKILIGTCTLAAMLLALSTRGFSEVYYTYHERSTGLDWNFEHYKNGASLGVSGGPRALSQFADGNIAIPRKVGKYDILRIGMHAFAGCEKIRKLSVPEGVIEIGPRAFAGCSSLASIKIPDSVTSIGYGAFEDCKCVIRDKCFASVENCLIAYVGKESNVVIPKGIRLIAGAAFQNSFVKRVHLPSSLRCVSENAFYGCKSLSEMDIPDSVIGIGESAFEKCIGLKSVSIPYDLRRLAPKTFSGCSGLVSVKLGAESIEDHAFSNCSRLSKVVFSSDLKEIGPFAFEKCVSLRMISLPGRVERIDRTAFFGCDKLMTVMADSGDGNRIRKLLSDIGMAKVRVIEKSQIQP